MTRAQVERRFTIVAHPGGLFAVVRDKKTGERGLFELEADARGRRRYVAYVATPTACRVAYLHQVERQAAWGDRVATEGRSDAA